ncbi:MAG: rubredoxin [Polyangiaceae bacterium]
MRRREFLGTTLTVAAAATPAAAQPAAADKEDTRRYKCMMSGYIYDPREGDPHSNIKPGTPFVQLPDDWRCPDCGASKSDFEPMDS